MLIFYFEKCVALFAKMAFAEALLSERHSIFSLKNGFFAIRMQ
jgi:hypothetical protein